MAAAPTVPSTESVSPRFHDLDLWPTEAVVAATVDGQMAAVAAVRAALPALAAAAAAATARLAASDGARLVYAGAGTSGRLAVQDGAELKPTYDWPGNRLLTLMAGGDAALTQSVEGAEDDADAARAAIVSHGVGAADVLIVLAASGRTPYALAAADAAREAGAIVIAMANNPDSALLAAATHPVLLDSGPEVVAGSTRMAAGTAQKAALTTLSTAIMVGLGRTYHNLMVEMAANNIKLAGRRVAMLRRIVDIDEDAARTALASADDNVKVAALVSRGLKAQAARDLLARHGDRLRTALNDPQVNAV